MTAHELIDTLRQQDIVLSLDGDTIECSAPRDAMTDELRQAIREHKAELLAYLHPDTTCAEHDNNVIRTTENSDVEAFARERLVWDTKAQTRGVDIISALKAWRIACKLPDDAVTWSQVTGTIIAHGCTCSTGEKGALWSGVGLRE